MNTATRLGLLLPVSGLLLTLARTTGAQEPGTNLATPPAQTPAAATPSDPPETTQAQPFNGTIAQEPVIDPETTRSSIPNRALLITGVVLLGASYGTSAIMAATSDRPEEDKLYYPVAGPWMALNDWDCNATPCKNESLSKGLLIGDGVVQGLGALGIVLSLVIPERTTRHWYLIGNERLTMTPRVGPAMTGLGMLGRF